MLSKKTVLLAKIETVYGTDPTPDGTNNVVEAIDVSIKETIEPMERPNTLKTMSNVASIAGMRNAEISFKTELKNGGTPGTAGRLSPLLKSCKMAEALSGGVSATYTPTSTATSSCTIWVYKDGRLHKTTGCIGTYKLSLEAGKTAILEFTFKGLYTGATAVALPTVVYETTVPTICKNGTFSYNSKTTLVCSKMEIDLGNNVVNRPSISAIYGLAGFEVTSRKPSISLDVESTVETSYDFRGDQLTTPRAVSYVLGATVGNIATISIPKVNVTNVEYNDNDGVLIDSLTGECAVNAAATGDDELSIVLT